MKTKELIAKLQELDPEGEAEVLVAGEVYLEPATEIVFEHQTWTTYTQEKLPKPIHLRMPFKWVPVEHEGRAVLIQ